MTETFTKLYSIRYFLRHRTSKKIIR